VHSSSHAAIAGVDTASMVAAFQHARTGMTIIDPAGKLLEANEALAEFLGYSIDELAALSLRDITFADDLAACELYLQRLVSGDVADFTLEERYVARSGEVVWGRKTAIPVRSGDGDLQRVVVQIEDLRERMAVSDALRRSLSEDELTGLGNRRVFYERLRAALEDPRRSVRSLALLVVNIDRFRQINAGLGQAAADLILKEVGQRLLAVTRGRDTVARLAGDEFAVLAPGITTPEDAIGIAVGIRESVAGVYWAQGHPVVVSAHVGVVTAPAGGHEAETLIRRATSAASQAKVLSSGWATHADGPDAVRHGELKLVGQLRAAIEDGDITVAYQPIVDGEGSLQCVEALARWYHPELGAIPPDQFIVLAEHNGLIAALTEHVMTTTVQQAVRWASTFDPVPVAVNLSGALLHDPGLVQAVARVVKAADLPPDLITLEITETVLADGGNPGITSALDALRRTGVRVSIDDFGTGYSSLAYLKELPVDELKIDRSFIIGLDSDPRTSRIVRSIIDLAHSLELTVVAEGVEDEAVASHLLRLGADYLQGFFIGKPAAHHATSAWLGAHKRAVPPEPARPDGSLTMDVLIVDEHPGVRAALLQRLTQRNHRVEEARNGNEAIDRMNLHMPDLVILNQPDPGSAGVAMTTRLREANYTGPIVLFSGSSPQDMAAIRFPIDAWPVSKADDETLLRLIDGYAAKQAARR